MRTQSNYMGKAKLQKKVLTTIMTGFLFAGISNTALADNVSVPDSKNDGQTIGAGNTAAGDGWSVEVGSDNNKSVYSVGDKNAISLRDNATIHIKKNAVVTNAANRNIGNFGTGANTIEVRSGSKITVDGTVQKYGPQNMGEAINVHGGGNTIVVNGSVIAEKSAAIWFQDWTGTGNDSRNSVINNGLIQRTDGGNVIGTSGGNGIDFTNNGTVNGSLFFAKGDDNLTFMPGSNVTGNIDGGGGNNKLTLDGGSDKVGGTLDGAIKNFTSLTKTGTGLWEITGPMQGFDTVDVQQGGLGLSGNNDGFTGKITVRKDASLSAKAESLPVNHPVNGNVGNIDLTNGGTLIFEQDDNGSYQGQIIGNGSVIKTGSGIVTLRPDAGANTYSGVTTIDGGGLAISSQDALGTNSDLTINNGSLTAEADLTIDKRINLASAEANKTAVIDTNGHNVTAAGVLNGVVDSGTFIKIGAGTLTAANNDNSFAGNVEVAGGALQIDGSGSKNFTGKIRVLHEAFLQGSGKVAGDVVNAGWLAPGSYTDKFGTFTVGGNYTGQPGGKLSIYSVLGGDASPTSKLVVEGDTEGSPTNIRVINQNGSGGYTDKGILIVDVQGKSDPNAFTLAYDYKQPDGTAAVAAGKYLYHLQYDPEDGDWYLKTLLNKDDTPVVNPSVPLYEAYPEIMLGYMKVNTLEERVGNRKWHIIEDGEPQQHLQYQEGTWFKTEGLSGKYKADRSTAAPDSSYDVDSWKMQMGYDKIISRQDAATTVVGGLNLQMGQARARIKSAVGNGKIKSDGKGLGGTMTWYKDNGVYVDTQAQAVWFDSDISSSSSAAAQQIEGNKGFGYGLSVETGKRIALKRPHWSWTPQMQLAYSNVDFDSFSDVNGLAVKRGSADSLQGRFGAALNYEKSYKNENDENYRSVKAYGLLNVYHEFHDGTNVLIAGDNFASKNDPTWLGLAVGGTYNYGRNSQYSLYGELGISTSAKNFGDSHVLRGEVGFRYRF